MSRIRAYVGLGSNVGDAEGTLAAAVRALDAHPLVHVSTVAALYATAPVGVTDQPEFRNSVVALRIGLRPDGAGAGGLLAILKGLERSFGRQVRGRWGPRELDLDLLIYGRWSGSIARVPGTESLDAAKVGLPLTVPHPEAQHRLFVLAPLADLAPRLVPPGWGETVSTAAARQRLVEGEEAVRRVAQWTGDAWAPLSSKAG